MLSDSHPAFSSTLVRAALESVPQVSVRIPVLGITGPQGSGKSTLAAQIVQAAGQRGLRAASVSTDDFYLHHAARLRLAHTVHPLLATRGPPGTHDLPLALATLDAIQAGGTPALPRFDKLADDRMPSAAWPRLTAPLDLLVLEGCFLKTPPQPAAALHAPVNALERDEDPRGVWRHWCNDALAHDYPPLWRRIDVLWFLHPPAFDIVPEWRWQQEQALQARQPGRQGMTHAQIVRFVQFFERVTQQSLRCVPAIADQVVQLDRHRRVMGFGASTVFGC